METAVHGGARHPTPAVNRTVSEQACHGPQDPNQGPIPAGHTSVRSQRAHVAMTATSSVAASAVGRRGGRGMRVHRGRDPGAPDGRPAGLPPRQPRDTPANDPRHQDRQGRPSAATAKAWHCARVAVPGCRVSPLKTYRSSVACWFSVVSPRCHPRSVSDRCHFLGGTMSLRPSHRARGLPASSDHAPMSFPRRAGLYA